MNYSTYLQVHQLTRTFNTADPFIIAEEMGFKIKYANLGDLQGLCDNMLGKTYIGLSEDLKESPMRYMVAAHELGHGLDHTDCIALYTISGLQKNKMEYQANMFACCALKSLYKEQYGDRPTDFKTLKAAYGVPDDFYDFFF